VKILIISDSHDHIANLKDVMGFAKKIEAGAVIHVGDWNTIESVETVLSYGIPLYSVVGNADIDPMVIKKLKSISQKFGEEFIKFELGGRKIGITHRPSDIKKFFGDKKLDIVFCGDRHSKDESEIGGIRVVRPGAIINGINFAVYETINGEVEFIQENK
jgi:hypothetical protein